MKTAADMDDVQNIVFRIAYSAKVVVSVFYDLFADLDDGDAGANIDECFCHCLDLFEQSDGKFMM